MERHVHAVLGGGGGAGERHAAMEGGNSAAIATYRWALGRNVVMRIGLQQLISVFLDF